MIILLGVIVILEVIMNFLRSFKLSMIFIFLCFSSGFGMDSKLLTVDSIEDIKSELVKYLVKVERADGRLIHEGAYSFGALNELLKKPANDLTTLKARQQILKELVSLPDATFEELIGSFKVLVSNADSFLKLNFEIQKESQNLEAYKKNIFKFFNSPSDGVMLSALNYASNALMLYMMSTKFMVLLAASGGFGVPFVMALLVSIFLGAMYEYVMGPSVNSLITVTILKDQVAGGGPEQFLCNGFVAQPIPPITEALRTKLGGECVKIDSSSLLAGLVPGFVKTCAGKVANLAGMVGNLPGISYIASSAPWINSSMFLGGGIIDLLHINRLLVYIKDSFELNGKKKKLENMRVHLLGQFDESSKKIKELNNELKMLNRMPFNGEINNETFADFDVYFGIASLIRESNKQTPGSKRFKMGFVDFIEPDQNKNRFEMHINNVYHFLKFKPEDEYKTAEIFADYYRFTNLDFVVSENNGLAINFPKIDQINFLFIYAQMLLAHTFGIVWGESAKMKFIDMSKINFISDSEKVISNVIFPAV